MAQARMLTTPCRLLSPRTHASLNSLPPMAEAAVATAWQHTPRNTLHTTWDIETVRISLSYLLALQTLLARAPTFIVHLPET
jgi:hypothetical protein